MHPALRFPLVALGLAALHLIGLQLSLAAVGGISPSELQWDTEGPLSAFLWLALPIALAQSAALTLPALSATGEPGRGSLQARAAAGAAAITLAIALPAYALADLPYWLDIALGERQGKSVFWGLVTGTALTWVALTLLLAHRARGAPDLIERSVAQATAGTFVGLALATPWYLVLRRKQQCFCALGTFWALVVGIWSLVMVGGPMLLLLARERRTRAALRG